ncbi:unnamed protein product, partial [marine sediment metagenome]
KGEDGDAAVDADISRNGFDMGSNIWFYPEGKFTYLFSYGFRRSNYTSDNNIVADPYHAGRDEIRCRLKGRAIYALKENLDLFAEYMYEVRDAEVEGTSVVLEQEDILDYSKHVAQIGMKVTF